MPIPGVADITKGECTLCVVNDFSDELKSLIRQNLVAAFWGDSYAELLPERYSYKNTLREFLTRYYSKDEKTKMGMIAELLSNILLRYYRQDIVCISVLRNKEDKGVKKGFDIIHFNPTNRNLWYSEIKSGRKGQKETPCIANADLLKRAKSDILATKFSNVRTTLWESAILDATLVLGQDSATAKQVRQLLDEDSQKVANNTLEKNAILVSVLYEPPSECVKIDSILDVLAEVTKEAQFSNVILFSTQKHTFDKVVLFLQDEAA